MVLETTRLRLAPVSQGEAAQLLAVFRDSAVRKYLLDDALVSPQWTQDEIASSEARFASKSAGLWAIRLRDTTEIVGFVGFREFFDPPQLQLLYGLLPGLWGAGVATEAARAVCDHAFRSLGFRRVQAAVDLPNHASIRVLERLGMTRDRTTEDGVAGTAFYAIDRDTWFASAIT